jgi:hypothetical protein
MIGRAFAVSLAVVLGVGLFGSAETFAKSGALPGGFSIKSGGLSTKSSGLFSARHGHSFRARFPSSTPSRTVRALPFPSPIVSHRTPSTPR